MSSQEVTQESKRKEYMRWHDYFMATAALAAERSKDPHRQVGACIVNENNNIVGIGYNGMPIGCSDDKFPWTKKTPSMLDDRDSYVCHAEMNAIVHRSVASVKGMAMYVTLFPCNQCAKVIIQSGITMVYYLFDDKQDRPMYIASKRMFDAALVKYQQYEKPVGRFGKNITINWDGLGPSPNAGGTSSS